MALTPEQLSALALGSGALADLGSGIAAYRSAGARASYQRNAGRINRDFAKLAADDVRGRGDAAANQVRAKGRQIRGAQRASYAAQGVAVDSGSAADVQADTEYMVELDVQQVKSNAWRQAFGMEAEGDRMTTEANASADALEFNANTSLLTGGLRALSGGLSAYAAMDRKKPDTPTTSRGAGRYQGAY